MSNMTYDLVVKADEQQVHSVVLDSDALAALVEALEWCSKPEDEVVSLLSYLAQSSSSEVRRRVAGNANINEDTRELLAKDEDVQVRENILYHDEFKAWATTEIVIDYIQSAVGCAQFIAGCVEEFTEVDTAAITSMLRDHSDPRVRKALASNYYTPKKILRQLLKDPEHNVRCAAKNTLD